MSAFPTILNNQNFDFGNVDLNNKMERNLFIGKKQIGNKNKLKVFLAHGDGDLAIPFAFHNETVKRIENFEGVKKYYYKNHGHGITDYEKIDMGKFINDTLNENSGCYIILDTILKLIFL